MLRKDGCAGKLGKHSFYNGFLIFLQLDIEDTYSIGKTNRQFMVIYKDAISKKEYHLLARLINNGQD